jgi:uncharacterized membrane protein
MPRFRAAPKYDLNAAARSTAYAPAWPVVILAGVGIFITLYLSSVAWIGEGPALCAPGAGCDVILRSQWSRVLGLPLALWGFCAYALIGLVAWRMRPGLRRWRRLWSVSLLGVAISVYLTLLGLVSHDAVCAWCLSSLATMTAIFAVVTWQRPDVAPGMSWRYWGLSSGGLMLIVVGMLHLYYHGFSEGGEDPRLQALAVHLHETGVRYYGVSWCPVCQEQNRLFGPSAAHLPYVECSPLGGMAVLACLEARIRGYPTWIINGERIEGLLGPRELAQRTGFDWDRFGR